MAKTYKIKGELTQDEVTQLCDLHEALTYSAWAVEHDHAVLGKVISSITPNPYMDSGENR